LSDNLSQIDPLAKESGGGPLLPTRQGSEGGSFLGCTCRVGDASALRWLELAPWVGITYLSK